MFTWLNAVPLLGEYEHLASYLKEMMSTISLRLIFRKNEKFGDLLNEVRIQLQPFDMGRQSGLFCHSKSKFFVDL